MYNKTNILIADSQFLIVEALKSLISKDDKYNIAGSTDNSYELNKILVQGNIDLLITDFMTIDYKDITDLGKIKTQFPAIKILVLTDIVKKENINELTKAGINTIIYKTSDKEELFAALEACVKGKKYYSGEILDILLEQGKPKSTLSKIVQLTNSEIEIIRLIAEGQTTKMIAETKNISFHTVMTHRKNIFRKLEINNASELLMYAVKNGLIDTIEYHI